MPIFKNKYLKSTNSSLAEVKLKRTDPEIKKNRPWKLKRTDPENKKNNGHYIPCNLGITVHDNWKWVLFIIIFWHYRLWEMEWGKFYTDSIWDYNGCYTVYGLENHLEMRGTKQYI